MQGQQGPILLRRGLFSYARPWHQACRFSTKNFHGELQKNLSNFGYYQKKYIHSHFFQFAPPFFPDIVCAEFLPTLNSSNKVFWKVACCRVIVCSVKSRFPNIGSFGKDCKDNFYESIGWKCSFYVTNRIKLSVFLYHMFFFAF